LHLADSGYDDLEAGIGAHGSGPRGAALDVVDVAISTEPIR
jgi:hypothetical protein